MTHLRSTIRLQVDSAVQRTFPCQPANAHIRRSAKTDSTDNYYDFTDSNDYDYDKDNHNDDNDDDNE